MFHHRLRKPHTTAPKKHAAIRNTSSSYAQEHASSQADVYHATRNDSQHATISKHSFAHIAVLAQTNDLSGAPLSNTTETQTEQILQRKPATQSIPNKADNLTTQLRSSKGTGQPLDKENQLLLEQDLHTDLSHVRIHTDPQAHTLANTVNAIAFTTGNDIFFSQNAYNPRTSQGQHLLAHEATHVVQQRTQPVTGTYSIGNIAISSPEDRFERAAEASARTIMSQRRQPVDYSSGMAMATPSAFATAMSTPNDHITIQRAATAKNQVPAGNDPTIPDLSTVLVTQLQAACTSTGSTQAADRQQVLDDLYTYLLGANIIDNDMTKIQYENTSSYYGLTDFVDVQDENNIQTIIFISSKAFDDGAPIVYSTIRHEAIHAEQMKGIENKPNSPNTPDDANDAVNYIDRTKTAELNGGGPAGTNSAGANGTNKKRKRTATPREGDLDRSIYAMQEIDTYVWEIENANRTGTAGDTNFLTTRYKDLNTYYIDLCTYARKIGKKQQASWRDYILRAKGDAERVLSALPTTNNYAVTYTPQTITWRA